MSSSTTLLKTGDFACRPLQQANEKLGRIESYREGLILVRYFLPSSLTEEKLEPCVSAKEKIGRYFNIKRDINKGYHDSMEAAFAARNLYFKGHKQKLNDYS